MTHIWLRPFPHAWQCSNKFGTALAQSVKSLFATMNSFENDYNDEVIEYQVEVVTFDGETEIVFVEAHNEQEAADKAAEMVENADYTMVY